MKKLLNLLRNLRAPHQKIHDLLTKKQITDLLNKERFQIGSLQLFGQELHYSDNLGCYHSIEELFISECYKFETDNPNPVIIDCGSNIGLSVIYFKKLYPNAKITAFEPDKEIFKLLGKNVSAFKLTDVQIINKAVSINNDPIHFYVEGSLAGSTIIDFEGNKNIQEVNATRLKDELKDKVDFLKIDIEGGENEVVFDLMPELLNVSNIFIEYHSIPSMPQKLGDILNVLSDAGFKYYIKEASNIMEYPFIDHLDKRFDIQLNIFGYRM